MIMVLSPFSARSTVFSKNFQRWCKVYWNRIFFYCRSSPHPLPLNRWPPGPLSAHYPQRKRGRPQEYRYCWDDRELSHMYLSLTAKHKLNYWVQNLHAKWYPSIPIHILLNTKDTWKKWIHFFWFCFLYDKGGTSSEINRTRCSGIFCKMPPYW